MWSSDRVCGPHIGQRSHKSIFVMLLVFIANQNIPVGGLQ